MPFKTVDDIIELYSQEHVFLKSNLHENIKRQLTCPVRVN